jgi:poly-beta-1,6-N-acetyl-D-glucosamine N-deacetylase
MANFIEHISQYIPRARRLKKAAFSLVILLTSLQPGFTTAQSIEIASRAVILMYHRFSDDRYPSTNTALSDLRAHIETIKGMGRAIVPLVTLVDALNGTGTTPENAVAITIDDAYRSVYDTAWPYLRENNIPFTLFVATEPVARGHSDYMRPEHLREMAAHPGVTIANHGHTHNSLAFADTATITAEIEFADALLAEWLDAPAPRIFAFPYGESGGAAQYAVEALGFVAAFGQHSGAMGFYQNRFYLPRFPMSGNFASEDRLREALSAVPLPHKDFTPSSPAITKNNPPKFVEFTLTEGLIPDRLNCFSGGDRLEIKATTAHVRIPFPPSAPPPRWRMNCTHPAPNGRWYWLGWQAAIEPVSR